MDRLSLFAVLWLGAPALAAEPCAAAATKPWTTKTEPGVTVSCGPHTKLKSMPGECALFTVTPKGGKAWTAWANEDRPESVRTLENGELLLAGGRELRVVTRETPHKDNRRYGFGPVVQLDSELTVEERARAAQDCSSEKYLEKVTRADADSLLVKVAQRENGKALPAVELKVRISDMTVSRITPLPKAK